MKIPEGSRTPDSERRLYERTVSNLDSQAPSIDARGALLYITIPALCLPLSLPPYLSAPLLRSYGFHNPTPFEPPLRQPGFPAPHLFRVFFLILRFYREKLIEMLSKSFSLEMSTLHSKVFFFSFHVNIKKQCT